MTDAPLEIPQTSPSLTAAGVVQLVSGLVNLLVISWLASLFYGSVGGTISAVVLAVCTLGICPLPIGGLCGFVGLAIAPIALLEIVSGVLALVDAPRFKVVVIVTGVVEILSIVLGNPVAVIAGLVSLVCAASS